MSGGWEASFGRFLLPNVPLLFHGWRYPVAVIIQALSAFELWLLPLSQEEQWGWQWCVLASVLGRADPCWPLGLNVPLYPSLGAVELCFFLVPSKGPETCGSRARHSWELLWMLWCGCPACWGHLEILRVSSPHMWEFGAPLFPANPLAKNCIGTASTAALELPVCPELYCLHMKPLLKLSVYTVDYIPVAFNLGRLLCS